MTKPTFHLRSLSATLLVLLFAGHPVLADDTEVLIGPGGQAWAKPNVLFIMDTSGSMGNNIAGGTATATDPSRLSIVQGVFANLMNTNSGFKVGLMRFDSGGQGGFFVTPMQELNSSTRSGIISASNNFTAGGNTPLSETLYEAARFYKGLSVDFGDDSSPSTNSVQAPTTAPSTVALSLCFLSSTRPRMAPPAAEPPMVAASFFVCFLPVCARLATNSVLSPSGRLRRSNFSVREA